MTPSSVASEQTTWLCHFLFRLQFEREEGNLDQFEDAEVKVKALMSKVAALRAK